MLSKILYIIIILLILYIIFITYKIYYVNNNTNNKIIKKINKNNTCDATTCNSIDPVSEPKYNMRQIIKQSILLEEHLANKNKRCRDCITKHFLHIIGLAEEAQMLSTNKIDQYPLINECIDLYGGLFDKWIKDYNKDKIILDCCDGLRVMRKKLIVVYYFDQKL